MVEGTGSGNWGGGPRSASKLRRACRGLEGLYGTILFRGQLTAGNAGEVWEGLGNEMVGLYMDVPQGRHKCRVLLSGPHGNPQQGLGLGGPHGNPQLPQVYAGYSDIRCGSRPVGTLWLSSLVCQIFTQEGSRRGSGWGKPGPPLQGV